MQRKHTIPVPSLIFLLGSLLCCASTLTAQEKTTMASDADAIPGILRVKVERGILQHQLEPMFFGDAATQFGIHSVRSWLNPDLLRYIDRGNGLYRTAPNGYETRAQSLARIVEIEYSARYSPELVARILQELPGVEYAEPVWEHKLLYIPNDPDVQNNDTWHLERIKAFDAWDQERADNNVIVAIIDTGIEREHEDLKDAIWQNPGETGDGKESNGIDDDNNGFVDDWWGYDFAGTDGRTPDNNPSAEQSFHGTHVAGIAAATGDNNKGVAGVAFGAQLMIVKISDGGAVPSLPGGFEGILYAAAMGADVINCSWGAPRSSLAEQEVIDIAVEQFGAFIVAAAGNDSEEALLYPAGYNNVFTVAATTSTDSKWTGSNYHYYVDLSAPGHQILSTVFNNQYAEDSGTSMAAPMVSGAAAVLLSKNPLLTPEELAQILRASADNISLTAGLQFANKLGAGRLNLYKSINNTDITSAGMFTYEIEDANNDGIVDAGEEVSIRLTVKNVLAASQGVSTTVLAIEPISIQVTNHQVDFGPMTSGATAVSPEGSFSFTVPESTQPDSRIVMEVSTTTVENTKPFKDYIILPVSPTYGTTELNRIAATFNSVGNLAYNGMDRDQGIGFYYGKTGSLLFHGGLMIGNSASTVVDVVRRGPTSIGTDNGFEIVQPYRLSREPDNSVEIGKAEFRDRLNLLGVNVNMTTYEFKADSNFVMVVYNVTNTTESRIDNLHCGLYLDWDLQLNGQDDRASWDENYNLGVVLNSNNPNLLIGTALLSDQSPDYYALDNVEEKIRVDFPDSEKWRMLSNGVSNPITSQDIDVGMVIGGGPVSIEPNESEEFAFGLLVAENLATLRESTGRAQDKYNGLSSVADNKLFTGIRLESYPNPFTRETQVKVTMPESENVKIVVYNTEGTMVRMLHQGRLESGDHIFRFDAGELPSGFYFYELQGESVTARGRLILAR